MAGLERLTSAIYLERQTTGSMLCAQHALNSLLQGYYFTAPDLSTIARGIDALEETYAGANLTRGSDNMDDTGFFSIQVLEKALNVWGLTSIRWRSEDMIAYHDAPESQQAFILNQSKHWYTIRRFGNNPGYWYNLNSSLPAPEWIGGVFLGMVLHQAEERGYSVFTIRNISDLNEPNPLPPCAAEEIASTLPHPSAAASPRPSFTSNPQQGHSNPAVTSPGFDDEDLELQAALQASLHSFSDGGTQEGSTFVPPPSSSKVVMGSDPVTASMARNRMLLARMQEEQAQALREGYEHEVARIEAENRAQRMARPEAAEGTDDDDEMEDIEEFSDKENEPEKKPVQDPPVSVTAWRRRSHPFAHPDMDDDAELEAAIKESLRAAGMEDSNEDQATSTSISATRGSPTPVDAFDEQDLGDVSGEVEHQGEEDEEDMEEEEQEQQKPYIEEPVSVDELRRRRLARFGG